MVAGLDFEVPKEYADRPLLKVRGLGAPGGEWEVGCRGRGRPRGRGSAARSICGGASGSRRRQTQAQANPAWPPPLPTPPHPQPKTPQGRATLEMKVNIRETPEGPQSPTLTIVLDGYNAPVSAGQVRAAGWRARCVGRDGRGGPPGWRRRCGRARRRRGLPTPKRGAPQPGRARPGPPCKRCKRAERKRKRPLPSPPPRPVPGPGAAQVLRRHGDPARRRVRGADG
jgi:hypothetical protein